MNLETLVEQLQEAKSKNLILKATMQTHTRPLINGAWQPVGDDPPLLASIIIQFSLTTPQPTLDKLKQFLATTFPKTQIQQWGWNVAGCDSNSVICVMFTVAPEYINHSSMTI